MNIELIGLPGSGKTFFSNALETEYHRSGKRCINLTYLLRNNLFFKIEKNIFYSFPNHNIYIKKIRKDLKDCLNKENDFPHNIYGLYKSVDEALDMIAINQFYFSKFENQKKIFLYDEGPLHAVVKAAANFNFSFNEVEAIVNILIKNRSKDLVVYNYFPIKDCFISIKNRNRHVCKFDELNDHELMLLLTDYSKYTEYIAKLVNALKIDRRDQLTDNIKAVEGKIV